MRLFRNAASVLATSVIGWPLYFLTSFVLARFLSVEDRGLYSVAITFVGLTTLLAELGWGPATIYRLRRVQTSPAVVAMTCLVAAATIGVVVTTLALPFESWICARLMDGAPPRVFRLALAVVPVQLFWIQFTSMARGLDRFALQNGFILFLNAGRLAGMCLVLIVLGGALQEALLIYLTVQLVGTLGLMTAVLRETGLAPSLDLREVRESLKFGIRAYASRLAGQIHERVDIFMLAYFLGDPREVAFYAVGVAVITQLKLLPEAIARALYPQLAGTQADRTGALAAVVARHSLGWVVLSVLGAALVGPLAIPLVYGEPYDRSVAPFLILLPGMALFTHYRILSNYFVAIGQQRANIVTQVSSTILNIALNAWWIPRWGILGAAAASLLSYGLAGIGLTVAFVRHADVPLRELVVPRRSDLEPYQRRLSELRQRLGRSR